MTNKELATETFAKIDRISPSTINYEDYQRKTIEVIKKAFDEKDKQYSETIKEECEAAFKSGHLAGKQGADIFYEAFLERKMDIETALSSVNVSNGEKWHSHRERMLAIKDVLNELFYAEGKASATKWDIDKLATCPDIANSMKEYMKDEYTNYADLFVYRAYQLGLEMGVEAKREFDNLKDKEETK